LILACNHSGLQSIPVFLCNVFLDLQKPRSDVERWIKMRTDPNRPVIERHPVVQSVRWNDSDISGEEGNVFIANQESRSTVDRLESLYLIWVIVAILRHKRILGV
jgi:hypothetical protein